MDQEKERKKRQIKASLNEFSVIFGALALMTSLEGPRFSGHEPRGEYKPTTSQLDYRKRRKRKNKLVKLSRRKNR